MRRPGLWSDPRCLARFGASETAGGDGEACIIAVVSGSSVHRGWPWAPGHTLRLLQRIEGQI